MNQLLEESGWEIWETPQTYVFVNRRIGMLGFWRIFFGGWWLTGTAAPIAIGIAQRTLPLILTGVAACAVFGTITVLLHRAYKRRRDRPLDDEMTVATVDRARHMIVVGGRDIAACAQANVTIRTSMTDSTRGLMRMVMLRTPAGELELLRTNSGERATYVANVVHSCGVP